MIGELNNPRSLQSHRVAYTVYQLTDVARDWRRSYKSCRPLGSSIMTWTQFSKAFLEKFVPYNLRDEIDNEFDYLEHGSMTIAEFEDHFHIFSGIHPLSLSRLRSS